MKFLLEVTRGLYVEYLTESGQVVGTHKESSAMSWRTRTAADNFVLANQKLLPTDVRVAAADVPERAVQQPTFETRGE